MRVLKLLVFYYFWRFVGGKSYIFGLRPIDCDGAKFSNGLPVLDAGKHQELYVFGNNLTSTSEIGFSNENNCDYPFPSVLTLSDRDSSYRGILTFTPPSKGPMWSKTKYYPCLKDGEDSAWKHQGTGKYVSFYVYEPFFTTWMYVAIIIICYMMSALMTGLNLGLMSLDSNELQLLRKAGTPKERKHAEKIIPVRKNGNFLVCSIVITATLCNAVSTIATETFFSGVYTIIFTTAMIVLFCEILPQSICSSFPLTIGAQTIYVTRACMILTFPVSYPLSKVLNYIVGKELTKSYNKQELREQLKKTHLPTREKKIISGTLDFSSKKVEEVMTSLDDIYKLPITAVMNFETIAAILASGYSRIPIYVGNKSNIQYVLLTKDLALLDPDDKVPVKVLVQNTKSVCHYVSKGTSLDQVFFKFKDSRHHMLFVTDKETISVKDSKRRVHFSMDLEGIHDKRSIHDESVIGLVTFEDIIEEIFQMEIVDETDTVLDNRGKKRLSQSLKTDFISLLLRPTKANAPSENLKLATYCFLSEVEEFSLKNVSPKVLINLLSLDIFYTTSGNKLLQDTVYVRGVPADFFVMILEGEMEVKIGNQELIFEAGAFRYFGVEALRRDSPFTPDYTLQGITKALYLKISRALYNAALLATRFERFKEVPNINHNSEVFKYFTQIVGSDTEKNLNE